MRMWLAVLSCALLLACAEPETGSENILPRLDLSAHEGRWVVVNYWAKWCKPCIEEIPELNALDARFDRVQVLGVNYDGATGAELQQQMEALGIAFPVLLEEPSSALGINLPRVLPSTLIFNPEGKLVDTLVGPQNLESLAAATGQTTPTAADPGDN